LSKKLIIFLEKKYMSNNEEANNLCKSCQICCRGAMCRVVVADVEKKHFPTIDFSGRRLSGGRTYFNQPCPHITNQGCQVYSDRPNDCADFSCDLLTSVTKGEVTLSAAMQTVEELKTDIEDISKDLRRGDDDHRGFRELRKWWIAKKMHLDNPAQSRRLWSVLKRLDEQFFRQTQLKELHAAGFPDKKKDPDKIEDKPVSISGAWNKVESRKKDVSKILLQAEQLRTPAYVVDDISLDKIATHARAVIGNCGAKMLYSVKANSVAAVIERLAPQVDGFSCSSLPEVQLVRQIAGKTAKIHFVGPGITEAEADSLFEECDKVSFNSLGLLERFGTSEKVGKGWGLRVNPHLPLSKDPRFNPCRPYSKLGISIYTLKKLWQEKPEIFENIGGLHVHNATGKSDFKNLAATVNIIKETLPDLLHQMSWINIGGGYRFHRSKNQSIFQASVRELKELFGLTVYVEPGTTLVRKSCWLMATVIDLFNSEGNDVAILDTSINHQLEGFIYEFGPSVVNASENGRYRYQLAGASCLAGDLLGRQSFEEPLIIGSRVLFQDVGAYTHAFTTRYNGLNPPDIYQIHPDEGLTLRRRFIQDDFASICGI
jgi:carboxynorspermidine decarboxylase